MSNAEMQELERRIRAGYYAAYGVVPPTITSQSRPIRCANCGSTDLEFVENMSEPHEKENEK